ncbi:MAG: hypothetical protein LW700_15150 [Gemmataceae bacterium]|jgi:Flp pilus assembly pilin Flp|nr:hypothetical protein [Gemmataceae bacterium]
MFRALKKFHKNEEGMEAVQVAMILAFAAVIILLVWSFWAPISAWFTGNMTDATTNMPTAN